MKESPNTTPDNVMALMAEWQEAPKKKSEKSKVGHRVSPDSMEDMVVRLCKSSPSPRQPLPHDQLLPI